MLRMPRVFSGPNWQRPRSLGEEGFPPEPHPGDTFHDTDTQVDWFYSGKLWREFSAVTSLLPLVEEVVAASLCQRYRI